jgi:hypothetical protein
MNQQLRQARQRRKYAVTSSPNVDSSGVCIVNHSREMKQSCMQDEEHCSESTNHIEPKDGRMINVLFCIFVQNVTALCDKSFQDPGLRTTQ